MGYDYRNPNIVYFVGNSSLPANTSVGEVYKSAALGIIVDINTSKIIEANITMVNNLAIDFISEQLLGRYLDTELEDIIMDLHRYQGPAQKAIIVALKAAYQRYKNYKDLTLKNN